MKASILLALAGLAATPALAQTPSGPAPAPPVETPPPVEAPPPPPPPPTATVAAPAPVQATVLRAPDLFAASGGQTGLPDTLWKGASADLARIVLPMAAAKPLSPAAQTFARRLAATGGQAPDGAGSDADLAAARIGLVLSLGDPGGAKAMLDHTPGVTSNPSLAQSAAEADLVLGLEDQACQVGDGLTQGKDQPYFRRLRAYCLLRAGNNDAAQLAYDLAESQAKDDVYKRLMSAAVSGTPAGEAALRNGIDFALSKRLMLDLAPTIDRAWRPILTVLAKDPGVPDPLRAVAQARLAAGPAQPPDIAAPVIVPLLAGDLRSARTARAQIERNDAAGATVLELALIDAALTTAEGRPDETVMDQLVERGTAGDAREKLRAQQAAALYGALGAPMSSQARAEFAAFDLGRSNASQARLYELQLTTARGDAALLALWLAADAGAAGPPPVERAEMVRALTRGGFGQDARAYALEGLIGLLAPPAPPPRVRPAAPERPAPARKRR